MKKYTEKTASRCAIAFLAIALKLAGIGVTSAAETSLHLIYLPHRLTETSNRQYDLLLDRIFADPELRAAREASPMKRALTLFLSDPGSCIFRSVSKRFMRLQSRTRSYRLNSSTLSL
ncbi:hypothetical protein E1180_04485 [Roseibium denhamense]|uniref:hypothetical protein n=1 Tax=Roseibium denhamense TaxID=76305 RepID=UPI0012BCCCFD|nr:hypothetical protein [Roseibium denhamense]MTI04770.1 hypothetical protein [Roseibium denhamense]